MHGGGHNVRFMARKRLSTRIEGICATPKFEAEVTAAPSRVCLVDQARPETSNILRY